MGLYLCIFDGEEELDGVEVGHYSDFGIFRETVVKYLEGSVWGSRFPTLMLHSDCDGVWSPTEAQRLEQELRIIADEFQRLPPIEWPSEWQREVAKLLGLAPRTLYDCFIDVDGESLVERLIGLTQLSQGTSKEILFQ